MKLAVIDDERPSRSELCHLILECAPGTQIDEADSGQKALELAAQNHYDAMFIDIHLGDMTGTTLSLMVRKLLPQVQIVFATAYDEYAVKAFDMDAVDFIMKPFDPKRVARAVQKLEARLKNVSPAPPTREEQPVCNKVSISCDKRLVLLDIPDIAYIETDGRNCVVHTVNGDYTCTQPLSYFERRLACAQFFRIHKSYLINLQYVAELCPWFNGMSCVKLKGFESHNLPVSRKQIKPLKELFDC